MNRERKYKSGFSKRLRLGPGPIPSPRLAIEFSSEQKIFDPEIFPTEKFLKYITQFDEIKSKFATREEFIEGVSIIYKYYPLKRQFPIKHIADSDLETFIHDKRYKPIVGIGKPKILLYDFFYPETLTILEYFLNFNLVGKKSNMMIVSRTPGYYEATCFYLQKYLHSNKFDRIRCIVPTFSLGKSFDFNRIRGVIDLFHLSYELIDRPFDTSTIDDLINKSKTKYDFILLNPNIRDPELPYHRDQLNHTFLIGEIYLGLDQLNLGGNLLLCIPGITTRVTLEIIHYVTSLFTNSLIYHPETAQSSYRSYGIIFIGFEGIEATDLHTIKSLNTKLYEIDPTGFVNYNILDQNIRQTYHIKKKITDQTQRLFLETFAGSVNESFTHTVKAFNSEFLSHFKSFLDDLEDYVSNKTDPKYLDYVIGLSISESIGVAKKLDLGLKPGVETFMQSDHFYRKLVRGMYSYDNIIKFMFRRERSNGVSIILEPHHQKLPLELKKLSMDFYLAAQLIDTRNPESYDLVKKYVRYYEQSLGDKLQRDHKISINGRRVSRAWIKFYEMVNEIPLLESVVNPSVPLQSFHICEAPGTFILSMEHYMKTRMPNQTVAWTAQSLHDSNIFDEYGLIKKYLNRWDFGPKNTGDITDVNNILYYISKYPGKKFLTADCGTSWDERELTSKLKYCMIILILGILEVGGNFVFKTLMPVNEPIIISLYYIMLYRFRKLIFFKPLQNPWSPEFYVVGIGYEKKFTSIEYDVLLSQVRYYDPKICLVKNDETNPVDPYNKFIIQLENITTKLKNNFRLAILRNIYFVDNWDKLSITNKTDIKDNIDEKNNEWIDRFILKKTI